MPPAQRPPAQLQPGSHSLDWAYCPAACHSTPNSAQINISKACAVWAPDVEHVFPRMLSLGYKRVTKAFTNAGNTQTTPKAMVLTVGFVSLHHIRRLMSICQSTYLPFPSPEPFGSHFSRSWAYPGIRVYWSSQTHPSWDHRYGLTYWIQRKYVK